MKFDKHQLINYLRSAASNSRVAEYHFREMIGEVHLDAVLNDAADYISRYVPDEVAHERRSFRSIMGVGTSFKVVKQFVYHKVKYEEGDLIEVTQFNQEATRIIHMKNDKLSKNEWVDETTCDFIELSEMYDNNFIEYIKK